MSLQFDMAPSHAERGESNDAATTIETMLVRAQFAKLLNEKERLAEMQTIAGECVTALLEEMIADDPALREKFRQEGLLSDGAWQTNVPLYRAIVEPITRSLTTRIEGFTAGQADTAQFTEGLRRQIGNLIEGYRQKDAPLYPEIIPRPTYYGRPGELRPGTQPPAEQPPADLPAAA